MQQKRRERIEKQKDIIDTLSKQKKALMQKIFSQELRFKDENGKEFPDWEEKKLGEIFEIKAGGDIDKNTRNGVKEKSNMPDKWVSGFFDIS